MSQSCFPSETNKKTRWGTYVISIVCGGGSAGGTGEPAIRTQSTNADRRWKCVDVCEESLHCEDVAAAASHRFLTCQATSEKPRGVAITALGHALLGDGGGVEHLHDISKLHISVNPQKNQYKTCRIQYMITRNNAHMQVTHTWMSHIPTMHCSLPSFTNRSQQAAA